MTLDQAFAEMKRRGWLYTSDGIRFGDPVATYTAVGPFDGTFVAIDRDAIKAVQKAIQVAKGRKGHAN